MMGSYRAGIGAALAVVVASWACERPATERAGAGDAPAMEAAQSSKPATAAGKIASAVSAAPAAIAANAAVMDWPAAPGGAMTELRKGTNGWTCMPDVPHTPGNDPMCLDASFLEWAAAWMSKTTPAIRQVGIGYMLEGGTDASNVDPYATEPLPGESWVKTGPHVMVVVPNPANLEGLPTDPSSGGPFVMWKGTPYAHVMVPVAAR
jgi:hypothetical protein